MVQIQPFPADNGIPPRSSIPVLSPSQVRIYAPPHYQYGLRVVLILKRFVPSQYKVAENSPSRIVGVHYRQEIGLSSLVMYKIIEFM